MTGAPPGAAGPPIPGLAVSTGPAISGADLNQTINAPFANGAWNPFGTQPDLFGMKILGVPVVALAAGGAALWWVLKR